METIKSKILIDKDYLDLIKRFPLYRIKNDKEMDLAIDIFEIFSNKIVAGIKMTQGELAYRDALLVLISEWERTSPRIQKLQKKLSKLNPQQILRSFMEDHKLSQSELARQIDCPQSVISDFLSGKRGLSKKVITRLSNHFKVSPTLFLPKVNTKSKSAA